MAKNDEVAKADEGAPPKKSKLKLIIILLVLLILLAGGAGLFWWFTLRTGADVAEMPVQGGQQVQVQENAMPTPEIQGNTGQNPSQNQSGNVGASSEMGTGNGKNSETVINLVKIPTVTVNLADKDPIRYLKLGMDVELTTGESAQTLESQIPKVRDAVIIILSGKTYADLATTAGKLTIKNEISSRINQIIGAPRVVQIYFTDFVIQ